MKVLAIEDESMSRFVLVNTLRSLGCEVEQAASSEEAWSILNRTDIRVVVADWRMPGEDGLELCRRVRARDGDYIYFILLTEAEASESNQTLANAAGVDDFLSKPVQAYELGNRLRVAERILRYTVQVRQLESFLPICGYCKKVRNDGNYWEQVEDYISKHTGTPLSQGICPDCYQTNVIPELAPEPSVETPEPGAARVARPTLGTIARELGISAAAVSMALRNHPRISAEMRERVAAKAQEVGYRPDPEIRRAMRTLRVNRKPGFKSVIYSIALADEGAAPSFDVNLIRGCETRAVQRGYNFVLTRLRGVEDAERLQRVLVSRGVDGLVLLMGDAGLAMLNEHFDWRKFSVVNAAHGGEAEFDAVRPHWVYAARTASRELRNLGVQRVGLVLDAVFGETIGLSPGMAFPEFAPTRPNFGVATYLFENPPEELAERTRMGEGTVSLQSRSASPVHCGWERLPEWVTDHRPEALVFAHENQARSAMAKLENAGVRCPTITLLNRPDGSHFAGVTQRSFEIGGLVIERLCEKIESGIRGASNSPMVTKVKGRWSGPLTAPGAVR